MKSDRAYGLETGEKEKLSRRLRYLGRARYTFYDWAREKCKHSEGELAIRLMWLADNAEGDDEGYRIEAVNEATRLIRDIYLTDRSDEAIRQAVERRRERARRKLWELEAAPKHQGDRSSGPSQGGLQ